MLRWGAWMPCVVQALSLAHLPRSVLASVTGEMLGNPAAICSIRLCSISGFDRRINDVVYCFPLIRSDEVSTVVFFGGDVQDFPENMETHRDNKNYVKWNLENTATLLHTYFPESHIVVVRPSRMEMKTFSCYDNFVPCNNSGAPNHTPMHHALQHLEQLLRGVSQRLQAMPASELARSMSSIPEELQASQDAGEETQMWWQKDLCLEKSKLILIGFSKGCVVLNQFIYEFHYLKTLTPDDESMANLVDQIQDMYWLDGGHAGGKNTWITSRSLLETLTRLNIGIHIHVTPYQINDDRRPWIRKEEKAFGDLLRRLGAPVHRVVHFENQVSSLCTHFEVLSVFHQAEAK
ncbi:hypothetical protein R5R35_010268 [Gryllus longicercus]|uniref:Uncharacterized protein n=1 Tax=Gryllus longicercus TaxID=2509291 RepID=A0AAN9V4E9_9ORTH